MGLTKIELLKLAESSFEYSFLPPQEKRAMLMKFHSGAAALRLV
jgi:hypothetical protein